MDRFTSFLQHIASGMRRSNLIDHVPHETVAVPQSGPLGSRSRSRSSESSSEMPRLGVRLAQVLLLTQSLLPSWSLRSLLPTQSLLLS
jgi:hypothetical protein